jgi:ribosome biogenesis GTPase A
MAHAASAVKQVARYLGAVVEVADARAPELTRYHGLGKWIGACPVLLVLAKDDLAEPAVTAEWLDYYQRRGQAAIATASDRPGEVSRILRALDRVAAARGVRRAAVIGLPNVGKSTLLNRLIGRHHLRTGNRPGVTRGPQWVRRGDWEWLDLPGVMTRRQERDWRVQALGVTPWDPAEAETVATAILHALAAATGDPEDAVGLEAWGRRHGVLGRGGAVDLSRTAEQVIRAFQAGRLGRCSLERPDAAP